MLHNMCGIFMIKSRTLYLDEGIAQLQVCFMYKVGVPWQGSQLQS